MSLQTSVHDMTNEMIRGSTSAEQSAMNGRWLDVVASTNNCFAAHVQILHQIAGIERTVVIAAVVAMRESLADLQEEIGVSNSDGTLIEADTPGGETGGKLSREPFVP